MSKQSKSKSKTEVEKKDETAKPMTDEEAKDVVGGSPSQADYDRWHQRYYSNPSLPLGRV